MSIEYMGKIKLDTSENLTIIGRSAQKEDAPDKVRGEAAGHKITTIEGLKDAPIHKVFLDKSALQCGYCTPAFVMYCHALVTLHPDADSGMIKEWLQSNLCRRTGYKEIKEAV